MRSTCRNAQLCPVMASVPNAVVVLGFLVVVGMITADEIGQGEELMNEILFTPETCERKTKKHDILSIHYIGTLTATGAKFDSSHDRNQPFEFQLGIRQVIPGWEKGLLGMCAGEKRKLTVPPHLAYGDQGAGDMVPPMSTLTFEVELLDIKDGTPPKNIFKEIDTNEDQRLSKEELSNFMKEQSKKAGPDSGIFDDQHEELIKELMEHEDQDMDGYISHEEFSGPKHDHDEL